MKKVLCYAPVSSGHLQKWISKFDSEFEIVVVTLHNDKASFARNGAIRVVSLPRFVNNRLDFFLNLPLLQWIFLKEKPDLIYASYFSSYGLGSAFLFSRCKKILSVWGTDVNSIPTRPNWFKKLARLALKRFSWINAPAEHIKEKLVQLGAEPNNVDVFQYGVLTEKYKLDFQRKFRESEELRFLSIRNWDELYNIDLIINAYSAYSLQTNKASTLTIIGRGRPVEELQSIVSKLNFGNGRVDIVGYVDESSLLELFSSHQFVISIPVMDGCPLSLLESMCAGLIPIVSDLDANREWLDDDHAIFVDTTNIDTIIDGFSKCSLKFEEQREILEHNRNLVVSNGCREANTKKLKDSFYRFTSE
ncbi:hypothetical protein C1S86_18045 [Vibrio parahaemolyticus]|uniref:glycosyltransferase family 4 protein n=1 Tax=Vibrio parahaemolyticus TaxID=670 RepID=UPI0007DC421F|nr:glycosyltransferase family 4 protein [Vibrio parahaemolyticus]EGU6979577.1 glycosyltransferase [Vibrio parahaemolyticus]EKB1991284.1 glycosyltransferase family 4 protein [Vibrio parahaemolyticus]EME0134579.1 glycosyltransferase family 4 protein [Vibrio parahaemolyticus]MBE3847967.1 glycosyltransferase family 4 protein [Vibrio parahaemolyticus]MCQ9043365.1 glycosyltransferase family 4 protein [Vibrio parahaemolyticus]